MYVYVFVCIVHIACIVCIVCIRMYLCVLHVLYVLYVLYVCACIENSISSHTYTYIQYMHIQTYALWGAHMHCMYVCIFIPEIHVIYHGICNTYTYALAGSLMTGTHPSPLRSPRSVLPPPVGMQFFPMSCAGKWRAGPD